MRRGVIGLKRQRAFIARYGFRVTVESVGRPVVSCAFQAPEEPVEQMLQAALDE